MMSRMRHNARYWIEQLRLEPHPEGGYYRVTYSADLLIAQTALPNTFKGARRASTAIYFLIERGNFSAFHRIASDELWHFYSGDALLVHALDAHGELETIHLGPAAELGQRFQATVPAGNWFASELEQDGEFALVGCTVAPGFDFEDFELGTRDELLRAFPHHGMLISRLTRS
jgi:predicted cupin superfamily sugar epimerase